jgi:hypothetical protein
MLSELKDIVRRIEVHWHALALTVVAMLPVLLEQLDGIDLHPILSHIIPANDVDLVIALLPFLLAVMRPMIRMSDKEDDDSDA